MNEQAEFEGRSVDLALERAAARSGLRKEEIRYEVLQEERGFLGVGTRSVLIRVYPPTAPRPAAAGAGAGSRRGGRALREAAAAVVAAAPDDLDRPEAEAGGDDDEESTSEAIGPDPTAPEVAAMVADLIGALELEMGSQMTEEDERIIVNLSGPDRDLLVERRGEALDAMQYLVNRMARKSLGTKKRIQLESDGFRSTREDEIRDLALEAAERVRRSGVMVRLPPLNPYERRIVHVTLSRKGGVVTESEGDGFVKRVMVRPAGGRGGRGPGEGRRGEARRRG